MKIIVEIDLDEDAEQELNDDCSGDVVGYVNSMLIDEHIRVIKIIEVTAEELAKKL